MTQHQLFLYTKLYTTQEKKYYNSPIMQNIIDV